MMEKRRKAMTDGIRGFGEMSVETDKQGAQLSQECPPPINDQRMGTNSRTAQCQLYAAACSDWAWLRK